MDEFTFGANSLGANGSLRRMTAATCSSVVLAIAVSRMANTPPHEWGELIRSVNRAPIEQPAK